MMVVWSMPTNLPAEAQKKLAEYQAARRVEDKIRVLEEALSLIPDHKGTEKMRRQLKSTLAKLRRELEEQRSSRVTRQETFYVRKEGAAQVTLLGAANCGKSSLLAALTNAKPQIAPYQLATTKPTPGMMLYEGVEIQLVELPAILTEELEETAFTSRSIALARNSDLIAIMLDGSREPLTQFNIIVDLLESSGISLKRKKAEIVIEKKDSGGIRLVVLGNFHGTQQEVKSLLQGMGIRHAVVKIYGDADLDDVEEQVLREAVYKKSIVVLGKADLASDSDVKMLRERLAEFQLPLIVFSALSGAGREEFKQEIFRTLDIIRVYTQKDGVPSQKPIIVPRGTTVIELAETIHRDFARNLRYARVWGRSVKIQGQQVGPNHRLEDNDLVELYV